MQISLSMQTETKLMSIANFKDTTARSGSQSEKTFQGLIEDASQRVEQIPGHEVAIDCSAVTTIKSAMLDQLIRLYLDARQRGSEVVLEHVNDSVLNVIRLTRLDRMLRIRVDEGHPMPKPSDRSQRAR